MLFAPRTYLRSFGWYAGNALLTILILASFLHLWRTSFHKPICYDGDGLQSLVFIKTVSETGWFLDNPLLGAPGQMDLRNFPLSEGLHFLILRALCWIAADPFVAANLFIFLCFPLSATTAMFVFRRYGCSPMVSGLASQLFAFLPYHLMRVMMMGHIFLGSYWLVPLAVWVVLRLYLGSQTEPSSSNEIMTEASPKRRWLPFAAACAFSFVFAGAGVYYAFFYCFFLCLAGLRAVVAEKRWAALGAAAALVLATTVGVFANIAPCLPALRATQAKQKEPLLGRNFDQADTFGLRVIQMILPISEHRLKWFKEKKLSYNVAMSQHKRVNENDSTSLGVLGAVGFTILLVALLRPRAGSEQRNLLQALSQLNLGAVLFGTVGGLGALVNFAGLVWIRAYNRIVVFIAFFAFFALVLLVDRLRQTIPGRWQWSVSAAFAVLVAVGMFDQTTPVWKEAYASRLQAFQSDQAFAQAIEKRLPAGSSVFQMPCCAFPEQEMSTGACGYFLATPYLHTRTLHWSYGTNTQQSDWPWQDETSRQQVPAWLAVVRSHGFAGVYVDRRGYGDKASYLESQITLALGTPPLVSANGQNSFFALPPLGDGAGRDQTGPQTSPGSGLPIP